MAVESAADRASFLLAAEFGVSATFTHLETAAASAVTGIFDSDYLALEVDGEAGVASRSPRFVCASADIATAVFGDTLAVAGVIYKMRVIKPDGTGITEIMLEKQ